MIEKRLRNLYHHHQRLKETYFPDWDLLMQENCRDEYIPDDLFQEGPPVTTLNGKPAHSVYKNLFRNNTL